MRAEPVRYRCSPEQFDERDARLPPPPPGRCGNGGGSVTFKASRFRGNRTGWKRCTTLPSTDDVIQGRRMIDALRELLGKAPLYSSIDDEPTFEEWYLSRYIGTGCRRVGDLI
jgi:hypothetical protein